MSEEFMIGQLEDSLGGFLEMYHLTLDKVLEQIESSHEDLIITQIIEYVITPTGDQTPNEKEIEAKTLLGQLIVRKYQIRQEEEDKLIQNYQDKVDRLESTIAQNEAQLQAIDDENNFKYEVLDG